LRIVHFITSLTFAGAEKQVVSLAKEAKNKGHEVHVVTFITCDGFQNELIDNFIPFHCIDYTKVSNLITSVFKLRSLMKRLKPNVIHSHMGHMIILARFLLNFKNVSLIETFHNEPQELKWFMPTLLKWSSRIPKFSSCVSTEMLNYFDRECLGNSSGYIPNAVDNLFSESFIGNKNEMFIKVFKWISIGRLIDKKGYLNLINACNLLKKQGIEFTLDIFGDGPLEAVLKGEIKAYSLENNITLRGVSTNLNNEIKRYDGFVSSSIIEAFGIVIIEALAAGVPVCVTDCIGPKTILGGSPNCGVMVEKESVESLFEGMKFLMDHDNSKLSEMSQNALKLVKQFNVSIIFDKWFLIYSK
jgi:glycosyltransferase involved in cell wall biosynthesis